MASTGQHVGGGMNKKSTPFRTWLMNMWYDNCDEHQAFNEPNLPIKEYYARYKYWLKREFKYQQRISK